MEAIHKNLRKIRTLKGLSQTDFAKLFDLTRAKIGSYEEGRAKPKMDVMLKIASYFNIGIDDLVYTELSVNGVSGFDISNFDEKLPINKKEALLISIPCLMPDDVSSFSSIGRTKRYVTVPREFDVDLVWYDQLASQSYHPERHANEMLLMNRCDASDAGGANMYAVLYRKKMLFGEIERVKDRLILSDVMLKTELLNVSFKSSLLLWKVVGSMGRTHDDAKYNQVMSRLKTLEKQLAVVMSAAQGEKNTIAK